MSMTRTVPVFASFFPQPCHTGLHKNVESDVSSFRYETDDGMMIAGTKVATITIFYKLSEFFPTDVLLFPTKQTDSLNYIHLCIDAGHRLRGRLSQLYSRKKTKKC